jgi:hypothetical protein
MTMTTTQRQRQQLIANVLQHATTSGHLVVLAAAMDKLIRVYDPETDLVRTVRLRDVTAVHVRAD